MSVFSKLTTLSRKYGSDKQDTQFDKLYDKLFRPLKYKRLKILEIGVLDGASMLMWREYFPFAQIHGADVEDKPFIEGRRLHFHLADQSNRDDLQRIVDECGKFDIIIEDGGHTMEQQQISFGFLLPHVKRGGLYILEDVQTSITPPDSKWSRYFGIDKEYSNTTLFMIDKYHKRYGLISEYLTDHEEAYCTHRIKTATLHRTESHCLVWVVEKL